MSKKLTKISLTILTLVCAFCMSIAMIGVAKADTTLYQAENFKMETAVQIRQNGTNGIRFWASMSADDYNNLKDVEGIEFGIMIAPTDWLNSADDLRFGNDALPEWYDGTDATKYFAKGVNVPVLDENDFNENDDVTEYILHASFVDIKESNFSRTFTAKAYYKVGDEVVYAQGANEKNIFETASKYVATTEFPEETEVENTVKNYVYGIVDKVAEVYTDVQVSLDADAIVDGVAYRDDQVSATATVSNGIRTLNAGVKLALTKDGEEVEDGVVYDAETQKFELATSGIFKLQGKLGSKLVGEGVDLTLKRRDVSVNVTTRRATTNYKTFENVADQTKVIPSYVGYNKIDAGGSESVNLLYEVTDPENASAKIGNANAEIINDPYGNWAFKSGEGMPYLNFQGGTTLTVKSIFRANYTDDYGITYSYEIPLYTTDDFAYYGKNETYFTATDGLIADITGARPIVFQDVPLTDVINENFIKFSMVSHSADGTIAEATKSYRVTVSEAGNPDNYVTIGFGRYSSTHLCFGVNAPCFGVTTHYGQRSQNEAALNSAAAKLGVEPSDATGAGHMFDNYRFLKPLRGLNEYNHDAENYKYETLGFSIVDSEFYLSAYYKDNSFKNWSFLTKHQQELQTAIAEVFTGFDNVETVDVAISFWYNWAASNTAHSKIIIHELGGEAVTAQNAASWIDKMYISVGETPTFFADEVVEG